MRPTMVKDGCIAHVPAKNAAISQERHGAKARSVIDENLLNGKTLTPRTIHRVRFLSCGGPPDHAIRCAGLSICPSHLTQDDAQCSVFLAGSLSVFHNCLMTAWMVEKRSRSHPLIT